MSELTTEHFDEVITGFKAHVDERFDKLDGHHHELMRAIAEVRAGVSDHMDKRFDELKDRLSKDTGLPY